MKYAILGLDIGTTSTKAVLFDLTGAELATAERPYRLRTPQPGWAELDPEELWQALLHVLRSVAQVAGDGRRILALALAAQSGSLLPARHDGAPLGPILTWLDGRTEALVARWKAEGIEEQVRALSGWHLYPGLCLPAIAWLREHQPDLFAAAGRFFSVNDFLVHRLTGQFCTNPSNAGGMQLLDVSTGAWSAELCALAGIEPGQLSPVLPAAAVVGPLTPEVSRLTGLPAGTLVVNGGHDQGCTALGLGVTEPGKVLLGCGTAWVVTGVSDSPDIAALPPTLDLNFHPASALSLRGAPATKQSPLGSAGDCFASLAMTGVSKGRWTISQSLGGLGASLEWLLRQCWPDASREAAFAALDAELARTQPGGDGLFFQPLTGGHRAPAGDQRGGLWGLRLDHSRADLARAVMEGAAYELRWALEPIRRAGLPVERMWMIGGAVSSPLWPAIVADVTGLSLTLPQGKHWPAIGAAILAGVGVGAFETLAARQTRFRRPVRQMEPDAETTPFYDECFDAYRQSVARRGGGTF